MGVSWPHSMYSCGLMLDKGGGLNMSDKNNKNEKQEIQYEGMSTGIGVGLALGAGLGASFNNVAMGAGLGMVIGATIGLIMDKSKKDDNGKKQM